MAESLTLVLSGPEGHRGPLTKALEAAGALLDTPEIPSHARHGYNSDEDRDPTVGWVRCLIDPARFDEFVRDADKKAGVTPGIVQRSHWRPRSHWNTPVCQACAGLGRTPDMTACDHCKGAGVTNHPVPVARLEDVAQELAELRAIVAEMKGA